MKKLLIVLFAVGLALGASAQRGHGGYYHGGGYSRSHVAIGLGVYAPFYPYYGFGYSPFYPYGPAYGYTSRPSKLDLEIADIKNDYADKIWSAREDNSLTHKQKRQKVHELKQERDQEIIDAKRNYYKY
jgi:hypothetical protein